MTEPKTGRTAAEIINLLCDQNAKALEILDGLTDDEHCELASTAALVAIQRAKGMAYYETIAAYILGSARSHSIDLETIRDLRSRGDQLYGMLNAKALMDDIVKQVDRETVFQDAMDHLRSLEGAPSYDGRALGRALKEELPSYDDLDYDHESHQG